MRKSCRKFLSRSPLVQNFPSEFALVKLVDEKIAQSWPWIEGVVEESLSLWLLCLELSVR